MAMILQQKFGHLSVVVVDDNQDVRSALGDYFSSSGAVVRVCQNAEEALKTIRLLHPDLVVSDLRMPGKDGFALLQEIQALGSCCREVPPVIALSETGLADNGPKICAAGFAAVLRKPFTPRDLVKVLTGLNL